MRLDSIAWDNLRRRKGKTIFLLLGMVVAMATVVTVYTITSAMRLQLADTFDEIGANIMVVPREGAGFSYAGVTVPGAGGGTPLSNDDIIAINNIPNRQNIAIVAPKVLGLAAGENGQQVPVMGVDFPYELELKRWWTFQGVAPTGVNDALLGSRAAARLGKRPGDTLVLGGRTFRVSAVLDEQGTEEDGLVFLQLLPAQKLLGQENRLSLIEVAAYCTTCPIKEIVRQINVALPHARATPLAEAVRQRQEVVDSFTYFAYAVGIVVLLAGALVIFLTMLSSVNERTLEIGIFRALGYRRSHVFEIVLTEAVAVSLVGGGLGYLAGMLAARWLGPGIAQMQLSITWNPLVAGLAVLAAVLVGVLASAYPAARAAGLDPAEALRFI